jgi:hypothetical protein
MRTAQCRLLDRGGEGSVVGYPKPPNRLPHPRFGVFFAIMKIL